MTEVLINKYRPTKLSQVVGQLDARKALDDAIKSKRAQAFLLSGPAGTGKTTMARIGARLAGATPKSLIEIDGATVTGVEDMRDLTRRLRYVPLSGGQSVVIVDEAHRISATAYDSALKAIEEPDAHVTWFLCTTNPAKLPTTIRTRCVHLKLAPLTVAELHTVLSKVIAAEDLTPSLGVLEACAQAADGSARQALSNLAVAYSLPDARSALELLRGQSAPAGIGPLCLHMLKRGSWLTAVNLASKLEGEPEGHRIAILNYLAVVLQKAKSDGEACRVLTLMEAFATPYHHGEKLAPLYLSLGRALFSDQGSYSDGTSALTQAPGPGAAGRH